MKIKIDQKVLDKNLDLMVKARIGLNPVIELTGILFLVSQEKIILISSNGEMFIKKELINKVDVNHIDKIGNALIPSILLRSLIKKLSGEIEIDVVNKIAHIKNEGNLYTINCLNASEYPNYDFKYLNDKIKIPIKYINEIISNVSFASTTNEINEIFNGINLKAKEGKLTATATNRYRISSQVFEIESMAEFDIVIYTKDFRDIFTDVNSKEVDIAIDIYKINVFYENTIFQSKLIDKPFVSFEPIFKNFYSYTPSKKLIISKKILKINLEKISFLLNERYQQIKINIKKSAIKIETLRNEIGSGNVIFSEFEYQGEELTINLNAKFLKDAINIYSENIEIYFEGPNTPIYIKAPEQKNVFQVITPIRSHV